MGEMDRNATGGWDPPVRGPLWWLAHKAWRKARGADKPSGPTAPTTLFRFRCQLCGEPLAGEAAADRHAERVHIDRTTSEARAAIRPDF